MSGRLFNRYGTASEHATFTGGFGEFTYDYTNKRVVAHDGVTAGGFPAAKLADFAAPPAIGSTTAAAGSFTTLSASGTATALWLGLGGATPDATNRLSINSPAALFNNAGNGVQIKVNRNATGDTGSFLFQKAFSGRAEIGNIASDDFSFKVSPDGSTFYEGIKIAAASGVVELPIGQLKFPAVQNPSSDANTLDDFEKGAWTPALKFGGASVGMTYGTQLGAYTKIGNRVWCEARIGLTAKGSSTGAATITGIPFTNSTTFLGANKCFYCANMAALTGEISGYTNGGVATLLVWAVTGTAAVTDANFTNTSDILMTFSFMV
jgi:hypothetical protein